MLTDKEIRDKQIKLLYSLEDNEFIRNNRINYTWISGEDTEVYPIQEWFDGISIQSRDDNPDCDEWFKKILDEYSDILDRCYVRLTDGSCPSTIEIKYKHRIVDLKI